MVRSHRLRQLAAHLAFVAALFGGVGMGAGNMMALYLEARAGLPHATPQHDPHPASRPGAHDPHQHHDAHHQGPAAPDAAANPVPVLPAHCLFCLDGIVPQPVAPPEVFDPLTAPMRNPRAAPRSQTDLAGRFSPSHPRDPPNVVLA